MTNEECGNQPAYPWQCSEDGNRKEVYPGLTKREQFAMAAMQGMLCADDTGALSVDKIAEWAVQQADTLIATLNKTQMKG